MKIIYPASHPNLKTANWYAVAKSGSAEDLYHAQFFLQKPAAEKYLATAST